MARNLRKKLSQGELMRLYEIEKRSLGDIAQIYGVSRTAIMDYFNMLGLKRRTRAEARLLAQRKGKLNGQPYYAINEAFFSSWSPEMAYILGLLMSDGCLSRTKKGSYRISLCLNDKELLENVARTMGSEHDVVKSKYQERQYIFIFGREKMAQDLLKLGMKPRKSLDIEFPYVPEEYLRDFIRGVFDGDGSVFYTKRSKKSPLRTKFVSASEPFMVGLKKALKLLGMPEKRIHCEKRQNPIYYIRYCHEDSLILCKILYENLKNNLYLKRKYDKFTVTTL